MPKIIDHSQCRHTSSPALSTSIARSEAHSGLISEPPRTTRLKEGWEERKEKSNVRWGSHLL